MIIMKVEVCKYKPEYYDTRKRLRKDIEKIFDFRQHGRSYHQIWPVARENYNLIERRLEFRENEDSLMTYYHTTFWKNRLDMEQFYDKYLKSYIESLKANGFWVKITQREVRNDRLIDD